MSNRLEINGWTIFAHPCFVQQIEALVVAVEKLKLSHPDSYQKKAATKVLAAIQKVITDQICNDPTDEKFRQGNALGAENKHWFRAKFLQQFRLFFRYSDVHKVIVLAWVNDEGTRRAYGSKTDAYRVFEKMLKSGHPPDDWDALISECTLSSLPTLLSI